MIKIYLNDTFILQKSTPLSFFNSRNTCAPFLLLEHFPNRAAVINMATWDNDTLHFLTVRHNAVQDIKPLWKLFRQSRFESEGRFPLNSRAFQTLPLVSPRTRAFSSHTRHPACSDVTNTDHMPLFPYLTALHAVQLRSQSIQICPQLL